MDNLLDLSHETYLHGGYIGTPEVAETPINTRWTRSPASSGSAAGWPTRCPPFYAKSTGITGPDLRWQDIEYHAPCLYLLHSRVAPAGSLPRPDGTDPEACHTEITYAITPGTDDHDLDFWMVARATSRSATRP